MIVRKIKDEEARRTGELFSIAFEFPMQDADKDPAAQLEKCRTNPESRFEKFYGEKWAAFEDDDRSMMAYIGGIPYEVEFDGAAVKMSGVGGVSSLAQYRRKGAIRGCFQKYLRDIYDEGFVFSTLYPFSANYYRQFGYECGELISAYQISLPGIPRFDVGGSVRLVEAGNCLDDVKKVYEDFRRGLNLSCIREDLDYRWASCAAPAKDCVYTYVYYNPAGEPKGVMAFTKDFLGDPPSKENPHFQINCSHFYFSDLEGFKGLMNHCRAFEMYYDFVSFRLPRHLRVENLIQERSFRNPLKITQNMNGMVRVVNVKRALELAGYRGDGELTLRVKDGMLPENDGEFHVRFAGGKALDVEKCRSDRPDAELEIGDCSRFLLGTHAPEELRFVEAARFHAPLEQIEKVFYKKPVFITESF